MLVINRPGASTTLGTLQVARAAPDGHTIVMVSLPHVSNYTLLKEMPYAQSDFIPITTGDQPVERAGGESRRCRSRRSPT